MIIGIGSDIVDIKRIKKTLNKFGDRFINRCFTEKEKIKSESRYNKFASYAKRYAAKEACSKALGTGLAKGIYWKDIGVINNKDGKPFIELTGNALKKLKQITPKNKIPSINLSISDEKDIAFAVVIISSS
tara:strand:+ start:252 stop:644 length:393 start_codon:yes stop_codon:yes gene_type:complete